jgi:hypothetical protein
MASKASRSISFEGDTCYQRFGIAEHLHRFSNQLQTTSYPVAERSRSHEWRLGEKEKRRKGDAGTLVSSDSKVRAFLLAPELSGF